LKVLVTPPHGTQGVKPVAYPTWRSLRQHWRQVGRARERPVGASDGQPMQRINHAGVNRVD
ncbi:hypothetical protein, partial [Xanthomonas phaseoli]